MSEAKTKTEIESERRSGADRRAMQMAEQHRLRLIVDRMADGVVIVSQPGIICFANPAAQKLFGRSAEDLVGQDLGFPVVVGDTTEVDVVRPQQHTLTAELRTVATEWDGEPAHLVSLRDITDRKRAEERAAELDRERLARLEAEAASQAKSDFLALMSHELRTPLNAVIGYSELLDIGVAGSLNPAQAQHVTRIRSSAKHLLGLVNEVLDLAKVETGQLSLQSGIGKSDGAAEAALNLVKPLADAKNIAFSVEIPETTSLLFQGDENRVRQVLVNLLNNAVKFTNENGTISLHWGCTDSPDAEARLFGTGRWHFFRISDTGIGIPPDKMLSIFDPFMQVDSGHARQAEGSGLGLAISRRLARLMKGDLTVRSELGSGSTFTLWLPDATQAAKAKARWQMDAPEMAERLLGLGDVASVLVRELDTILAAFANRLRQELEGDLQGLRACQITDHAGSYVADLACTLSAIEDGRGEPSSVVSDSTHIQNVIAERHGAQRGLLGWTPNLLQREWMILGEEMKRIIRLQGRGLSPTAVEESCIIIDRMIEQTITKSSAALNRVSLEKPTSDLLRQRSPTKPL